jgi:hypothetical protein
MLKSLPAILILATIPLPAVAGWAGAEWGMSREQVAAVRGERPLETSDEGDVYTGAVGKFSVRISYKFESDVLTLIQVSPPEVADCPSFKNAVRDTYAAPFSDDKSEFIEAAKWSDEANGNIVTLFDMTTLCGVMYEPAKSPNSGGF